MGNRPVTETGSPDEEAPTAKRGHLGAERLLGFEPLLFDPALGPGFGADCIDPGVGPEITVQDGQRLAGANGRAGTGPGGIGGERDRSARQSLAGDHGDPLAFTEQRTRGGRSCSGYRRPGRD